MLYQIYETQRSFMEPFSDLAQTAAKLYSSQSNVAGQNPMAQRVAAGYDLFHRLGKDYVKPEFGIRTVDVDGVDVAIHERIEIKKPFCELLRFKRYSDDTETLAKLKNQPPVLIVAPLSGHYATLLRDTVRTMLGDHKVYITDWKNARLVPLEDGEFHLDDYINYVQEFIRHVQSIYGNCHVVSVCQPTVPVLAAISLMASRGEKTPLTMTMMGGPIDARKSPTAVNNLATNKGFDWFENNVIYRVPGNFPGAGRRVYPGFLQHTGFVAMNPDRHATSHYDYFKDLIKGDDASIEAHRKFYDEYNAVLDMDADYYLETIRTVFQDFNLVYGTWNVKGVDGRTELVRPQDITTTAMLTVEGELDDISGSGQTAAAHDLCTGIANKNRQHLEVPGAGHYGIFSGRRWRDVVYPEVRQFILNHAATAAKAPVKAVAPAPAVQALAKPAAVKKAAPAAAPVKRPEVTPVAVKETPVVVKATPKVAVKAAPKATAKPLAKQAAVKVPVKATVKAPVKAPAKVNAKPASKAAAKTPSVKTAWVDTAKPKAKA
jgi:poly(3-hydroxybutyrate) depolymerase